MESYSVVDMHVNTQKHTLTSECFPSIIAIHKVGGFHLAQR